MNTEATGTWLQIVANVGIIGGLLLVGVQLKQNADLLKTQLLYEESYRATDLETKFVGENAAEVWAKSLTEPTNLTLAEQRIMEATLWSFVEQLRGARMLAELGLLDEDEWQARIFSDAAFFLGNPYGRAWWENYSSDSSVLAPDLVQSVNQRLAEAEGNYTFDYAENLKKLIKEP